MLRRWLIAIFTSLGLATLLFAQTPTAINDLTFGNVFPGVPKEIDKKSAGSAAEFAITGTPGEEILINFTLPVHLTSGSDQLLMIFPDTSCAADSSDPVDQSNPIWDNQDPRQTITATLGSAGLTVWLGGKVIPNQLQPEGSYSGEIVIFVTPSGT
ncbi:hypothetical protein GF377_09665 [candidate division GN15 bacterium]|nr:hypothetical protein [candidate division GN15 bacterium]